MLPVFLAHTALACSGGAGIDSSAQVRQLVVHRQSATTHAHAVSTPALPCPMLSRSPTCRAEWRGCVPDRERQRELLSKGVLRFDGHSVRFASNLAASYAAEQLRAKLAKSVADVHKGLRRPGWW